MSVITFIDFEIDIKLIISAINSLKSCNYVQLVNFICNDIVFDEHKANKNTKTLADYFFEDIERNIIKNIETDVWWTVCRMLFKEHYKLTNEIEPITITNVSKNGVKYMQFKFIKLTNSKIICDGVVSHQQIEFSDNDDINNSEQNNTETDLLSFDCVPQPTKTISTTEQDLQNIDINCIGDESTFSCDLRSETISESVSEAEQTNEQTVNNQTNVQITKNKNNESNFEEMDENEFTKKFNALSDIDKFIVKHISWFKIGVAIDEFLLRGYTSHMVSARINKYCEKTKCTYNQYCRHIEENILSLGKSFTTRVYFGKNTITIFKLKDPKLSKHAGYLFRMAKRVQQQS